MFKVTTTFRDLNGKQVTGQSWFNISRREATILNAKYDNNIVDYINSILDTPLELLTFLEDIVLTAYGRRSEDNLSFIKNDEIREEFRSSLEFDQLILDLLEKDGKAQEFMTRTLNITDPKDIQEMKNATKGKVTSIHGQPPRPSGNRNRKPRNK